MPRLRRVHVDDFADAAQRRQREPLASVAADYQSALWESGLTGPASLVNVVLHPSGEQFTGAVQVLVYCDKPSGMEIVTATMPPDWTLASDGEVAGLVSDILHAALIRLGTARDWDRATLSNALDTAERATNTQFAGGSRRWPVVAEGRGANAPEQPHEIVVVGGGPTHGVPKAYLSELNRLLELLAADEWTQWWSHSPVKLVDVYYWFNRARPGVRVRVGATVTASIDRPVATIRGTNPQQLAREDVTSLVARLTSRLNLPPPPELL